MGGSSSSSSGAGSRAKGASLGAEKANVFGNAEKAAKARGNNPGAAGSLWGRAGTALGTRQAKEAANNANSAVGRDKFGGLRRSSNN